MSAIKVVMAALVMCVTACSSNQRADVDWNEGYDFSQVKTYRFIDREKLRSMTPLTSDITRNRIENAIEKTLQAKGFSYEPEVGRADALVSYHVTTKDKQDIRTYNTGVRHCWGCGWGRGMGRGMGVMIGTTETRVRDYTEGTLIIDILDPKTNESVWRGFLSARITDFKNQQDRIDAIYHAVRTILAQYPPEQTTR